MRDVKQSTATDRMVFLTDSTDHVTGKTGLTLTITASKAGAAFASITPTVTERGSGWYSLALTTTHTNTLGDLALHITGTGADPADLLFAVTANTLDDILTDEQVTAIVPTAAAIAHAVDTYSMAAAETAAGGAGNINAYTNYGLKSVGLKGQRTSSTTMIGRTSANATFATFTIVVDATLDPIASVA